MSWRHFPEQQLPEILEASLVEIVAHGYDATSVRTIAKRVGVSVPALYYHYENKQAILTALLDRAMDILEAHVHDALEETPDDTKERFAVLVEAIVLYVAHHHDLAMLDREIRSLTPENHQRYADRRDRIESLLTESVVAGCDVGLFHTPLAREASRAILGMCLGIATWYRDDGPLTPDDVAERYVTIALDAVRYTQPAQD